jgi:hypothetical protein
MVSSHECAGFGEILQEKKANDLAGSVIGESVLKNMARWLNKMLVVSKSGVQRFD